MKNEENEDVEEENREEGKCFPLQTLKATHPNRILHVPATTIPETNMNLGPIRSICEGWIK